MKKETNLQAKKQRKRKIKAAVMTVFLCTIAFSMPVFADAATDAGTKLVDFIVGIARLIGVALILFGIIRIGTSMDSHDSSQRAQGFLSAGGGLIVCFAKEIMYLIGITW